jgi:hypothetical protein
MLGNAGDLYVSEASIESASVLADIEAIRQLKARYCRLVDAKEWDAWSNLFTEGAQFILEGNAGEPLPTLQGRDVFVRLSRESLVDAISVHHVHAPEIDVDGDRATGIWAMSDDVELPHGIAGLHDYPVRLRGTGHYHEEYVRDADGRWRIASLRLTRIRTEWTPLS